MHLLMIEDSEDDYLLLSQFAARISDTDIAWCDTLTSGLEYIEAHTVDVLLLDLALPDGHGLATLERVQTQFPNLPIIVLSGHDDDDVALEAVQHGAQDYLVKNHVDERILGKALRYAVERKRAEQRLITERNLLRTLIDSMPDYIFIKDAEGRVIITNQANAQMVGVNPIEVIGKTADEIFSPELAERYDADDRYVRQSGKPLIDVEREIIDASGAVTLLLVTKIPLHDESGQVSGVVSISRDMSEIKRSEARFRNLLDTAPDAMVIVNQQGEIVLVNVRAQQLFGYTSEEMIGQPVEMLMPETFQQKHHHQRADYYANPEIRPMGIGKELTARHKDGSEIPVEILLSPLETDEGRLVSSAIRDISERKQIEKKLRDDHNLLRTVIDNMPDYIFVKDRNSRLTLANRAVMRDIGATTQQEVIGKSDFDVLSHDLAEQYFAEEQELMATGRPLINRSDQITVVDDDMPRWVLSSKVPLRDSDGNIVGLVGINRDITELREAEEKFRQERDLLRALIDSTPDYIFIKDAEGRFLISNLAHAHAVKASTEELVGKTAFDLFPHDLAAQYHRDDEQVIRSGKPLINVERSTIDENGEIITVLTSKIPLAGENGHTTSVVGISRDITERKKLEARTIELASERERMKVLQRFIHDMSHDLRTPLAVIGSSVYLLQRVTEADKRQYHTEKIQAQLTRLDKLLNEMLQMAQLDRHDISLQFELVEINDYMKQLVEKYAVVAASKEIDMQFVPCKEPCFVNIDTVEFAGAFTRLLENAIIYTEEDGSITVHVNVQNGMVNIAVQDTGIGIAEKDLPRIFERFYRADQARSARTGGHGLGLAIAQSVIEAHGGSIIVKSSPDEGSTFTVTLLTGTAPSVS